MGRAVPGPGGRGSAHGTFELQRAQSLVVDAFLGRCPLLDRLRGGGHLGPVPRPGPNAPLSPPGAPAPPEAGPKWATRIRLSSWTLAFVVSMTRVARARSGARRSRSRRTPSRTARALSVPLAPLAPLAAASADSGCGRRVSLNRRSRV